MDGELQWLYDIYKVGSFPRYIIHRSTQTYGTDTEALHAAHRYMVDNGLTRYAGYHYAAVRQVRETGTSL